MVRETLVCDREKAFNCIVLLGATASGKTGLGVHLARKFGGEILSADSRQVYRGLDIGSGKDLCEYAQISYHLIDVADLPGEYSVFNYQRDFYRIFTGVTARHKLPVIVGGTGMYLDSVIRGYAFSDVPENPALRIELSSLSLDQLAERLLTVKKEIHNRTDLLERPRLVRAIEIAEHHRLFGNKPITSATPEQVEAVVESEAEAPVSVRPDIRPLILGIRFDRAVLRARIRMRLDARIGEGLSAEVSGLHERGISWERLERLGLEYRFTAEFLQGKIECEKTWADSLYIAIGQFAKRQETWFRGMERKGITIHWIDEGHRETADRLVSQFFREE